MVGFPNVRYARVTVCATSAQQQETKIFITTSVTKENTKQTLRCLVVIRRADITKTGLAFCCCAFRNVFDVTM